jgi:uncharacterized protein YbjT (DUF2867 family)
MTTLVIGANGKIGRILMERGTKAGLDLRAMVRDPAQKARFEELGAPVVGADLLGDLDEAFEGVDRVVFTAGSGPHTGLDGTLLVDLHGAVRSIDRAIEAGVAHYVMVSAMRADDVLAGPEKLRPYLAAKHAADRILRQSGLPYTVVRPGRLTDDEGTGKVRTSVGDTPDAITIPRADVAEALVALLEGEAAGRTIDLLSGDTPIRAALAGVPT